MISSLLHYVVCVYYVFATPTKACCMHTMYLFPLSSVSKIMPHPGMNLGSLVSHSSANNTNIIKTNTSAHLSGKDIYTIKMSTSTTSFLSWYKQSGWRDHLAWKFSTCIYVGFFLLPISNLRGNLPIAYTRRLYNSTTLIGHSLDIHKHIIWIIARRSTRLHCMTARKP